MTTKMTSDPWEPLEKAHSRDEFSSRLVGEEINPTHKKVFWASNSQGMPCLLIEYPGGRVLNRSQLPTFKNIQVRDFQAQATLSIELLDVSMKDVFHSVCIDIIENLQLVSENGVHQAALFRLNRWSFLLKPSREKLGAEQQKGLIAELIFIRDYALSHFGERDAIAGWTGPEGSKRDFEYGQFFVEVKSKRNSSSTSIVISSEEQLNTSGSEQLLLFVKEINSAPIENREAFSISHIVEELKGLVKHPFNQAILEQKLFTVGFFEEDDYSDQFWTLGESYFYNVERDFPRLCSNGLPLGVFKVSYQIDLDECSDYIVEFDQLNEIIGG